MSDKNLILVVDDEEDIREILGMQIEELEFEWIGAPNGQEALEILKTEPVDVVISDVTMPKMNGIDFLRNCRLNGYEYPFIVLTGNGTKNTAMEALRLGAFDFLEKPFDPSHMKSLFADAMKSSKEQQSSSGEPTSADTPKKSSDLRLPVHEESSSWEKGENLAEFIESYANQMAFCKASVKGLVKKSQVPIELGYLYRVMRSLASNSRYWSLYDLSSLSHELTENLLYFRTNPDYLNKDNIQTISNALNTLINVFSALKQDNSVIFSAQEIRNELKSANLKLNPSSGNDNSTTVDLVEEDDEMLKAV